MQRLMLTICLISVASTTWNVAANSRFTQVEEIRGSVVAYDHWLSLLPCYHICAGSLILRVEGERHLTPGYIRIDFQYPAGEFPKQLLEETKQRQFKLMRTPEKDSLVEEHLPIEDAKTKQATEAKVPRWKSLPGSEGERLPFGDILRSYRLLDDVKKQDKR